MIQAPFYVQRDRFDRIGGFTLLELIVVVIIVGIVVGWFVPGLEDHLAGLDAGTSHLGERIDYSRH